MPVSTRSGWPRKPFMLTAATRVVCMVAFDSLPNCLAERG
jgi:hypothetical protein